MGDIKLHASGQRLSASAWDGAGTNAAAITATRETSDKDDTRMDAIAASATSSAIVCNTAAAGLEEQWRTTCAVEKQRRVANTATACAV